MLSCAVELYLELRSIENEFMCTDKIVIFNGLSDKIREINIMNSDKDSLDTVLENPCHAHLLPSSSPAIVATTVKKERSSKRKVSDYLLLITLSTIIIIQLIALVFLLCEKFTSEENCQSKYIQSQNTDSLQQNLFQEVSTNNDSRIKEPHRDSEIEDFPEEYISDHDIDYFHDYGNIYNDATFAASDSNLSANYGAEAPWDVYDIKPRCFSMCEPPELFFREKLSFICKIYLFLKISKLKLLV